MIPGSEWMNRWLWAFVSKVLYLTSKNREGDGKGEDYVL